MEEDRLSQLPLNILHHHVLFFLPQREAVRTCILSKTWRHLGPTCPKVEFHETAFLGSKEKKFIPAVENTLQRYDDKNLPVRELVLSSSTNKYSCSLLLNKWIVKLHMLKRLSLKLVYIEDSTFDKIMSSCPLIQHLVLDSCSGLRTIKLNNKAPNLKHFVCFLKKVNDSRIEIDDAPSLETICIEGDDQRCWYRNYFLSPRIKSLCLMCVHLPNNELFNNNLMPCLEELELRYCSGFSELKLSNPSIKRLIINMYLRPIEVLDIDVANILYFELKSRCLPMSFSFATTSRDWKSRLGLRHSYTDVPSTWSLKLYEILKALRKSQISLDVSYFYNTMTNQDTFDGEPIVVQHLYLTEHFLRNDLFHICRPRYIRLSILEERNERIEKKETQLALSIWNTLENKGQSHFWERDLEESSIQVFDENTNEWRDVQGPCNKNNRFRLKWRTCSS